MPGSGQPAVASRPVASALALCASLLCGLAQGANPDTFIGSAPKYILDLMQDHGCSPIPGFYDRNLNGPPFVRFSGDSMNLVAFVCRIDRPAEGEYEYKMVFLEASWSPGVGEVYSEFKECASELHFWRMPGGLSVNDRGTRVFRKYGYWGDPRSLGTTPRRPLWTVNEMADGFGSELFCENGTWHVLHYH